MKKIKIINVFNTKYALKYIHYHCKVCEYCEIKVNLENQFNETIIKRGAQLVLTDTNNNNPMNPKPPPLLMLSNKKKCDLMKVNNEEDKDITGDANNMFDNTPNHDTCNESD